MSIEEKKELLADTFDMDVEDVDAEKVLADMEEWDSMTKLSLIVLCDDEFDKKITSDDIKKLVTIQDILNLME